MILKNTFPSFAGLDLLTSAVLVLDAQGGVLFANAAAESLLDSSMKALAQQRLTDLFLNGEELLEVFHQAVAHQFADKRQDLTLERAGRESLHVHSIVTALDNPEMPVLIEFRENVQQLKLDREERMLDQSKANKELIRNLAHEIKNPLGGIRGAAQLLELELPERHLKELREGAFDALVGVNLLREGLDLPEVSLVAILDADKEGFLRSETSLMQTIGRAARNTNAKVLLYADKMTDAMQKTIDETSRRRQLQDTYNKKHNITPETIRKEVKDKSVSFWIDLNVKSLLPRLKNLKKRPLLNQNNLEKRMNKI